MSARFVMGQKLTFELMKLIEAEYTKSQLSDVDFATLATGKLEPAQALTANHVGFARKSLGIPSNVAQGMTAAKTLLDAKVSELEDLVLAHGERLDDCIRKIEALQRDFHLHPPGAGNGKR